MDPRHGWLPNDSSHYITRRHPLLRLCHLRSDRDHRHLLGRTGSCGLPPLSRYRNGARELRKGSRERRCSSQRDNLSNDVLGWNLLAPRDIARHNQDHSELHATNIREQRTKGRADLCRTCPSLDKHPHSPRLSSVLHHPRQRTLELVGRIAVVQQLLRDNRRSSVNSVSNVGPGFQVRLYSTPTVVQNSRRLRRTGDYSCYCFGFTRMLPFSALTS